MRTSIRITLCNDSSAGRLSSVPSLQKLRDKKLGRKKNKIKKEIKILRATVQCKDLLFSSPVRVGLHRTHQANPKINPPPPPS